MALYWQCHLKSNGHSNQREPFWNWSEKSRRVDWMSHMADPKHIPDRGQSESYDFQKDKKKEGDSQNKGLTLFQNCEFPDLFLTDYFSQKIPVFYLLPASWVSQGLDKEQLRAFCRIAFPFIGSLPLFIHPKIRLRGMTQGVLETRCPGFLGSCQDCGLGDMEYTLVNRGASHHQFSENTIW